MSQIEYLKDKLEATISPMDYLQIKKENPEDIVLVDVRNAPAKFKEDKIEGAIEIMQKNIEDSLDKLPKDKLIVVYCWEVWCNLATKASITLLKNEYKVKELVGGIAAWKELNLPIEKLV